MGGLDPMEDDLEGAVVDVLDLESVGIAQVEEVVVEEFEELHKVEEKKLVEEEGLEQQSPLIHRPFWNQYLKAGIPPSSKNRNVKLRNFANAHSFTALEKPREI